MTNLKLTKKGFDNLARFVDSIPVADLKTSKDIRLSINTTKDLNEANKEYLDMVQEYSDKQMVVFKKHKELYVALPEEEKSDEKQKEFQKEMNKELDELDTKELEAQHPMELEAELGNDKMAKLKEWFEAYGSSKYTEKEGYIEVADALEL